MMDGKNTSGKSTVRNEKREREKSEKYGNH